jgi:hypothetical protein
LVLLLVSVGCGGGGGGGGQSGGSQPGTPEGILTGFSAGAGYDEATGLGSINAANLVNATAWAGVPPAAELPVTVGQPKVTVAALVPLEAFALTLGLVCFAVRRKQMRWTMAALLVMLGLSIFNAATTSASRRVAIGAHKAVAHAALTPALLIQR